MLSLMTLDRISVMTRKNLHNNTKMDYVSKGMPDIFSLLMILKVVARRMSPFDANSMKITMKRGIGGKGQLLARGLFLIYSKWNRSVIWPGIVCGLNNNYLLMEYMVEGTREGGRKSRQPSIGSVTTMKILGINSSQMSIFAVCNLFLR